MRHLPLLLLPLVPLATPAAAEMKLAYADWAAEPAVERELVIAALLEGLTGIRHTDTLGKWTAHFGKCVADKGLTSADLVKGVDGMVAENTSYSGAKLLVTLTHYLELQCGKPADDDSAM